MALPGLLTDSTSKSDYEAAYAMWKSVWSDTFRRLDGLEVLYSDDFNRQHELICLFKGRQCLGLVAFRQVDINLKAVLDDSYFRVWPSETIERLMSHGNHLMISSNLTVHPLARSQKLGLPVKDILAGLAAKKFLDLKADVMVGVVRVDRGMDRTTYKVGAIDLASNLVFHSCAVNLIIILPQNAQLSPDPLAATCVEHFWIQYKKIHSQPQKKVA